MKRIATNFINLFYAYIDQMLKYLCFNHQLIKKIVHVIDPSQQELTGVEQREDTVNRISEFLRVLKYSFHLEPDK
jgi:hypothetical protein